MTLNFGCYRVRLSSRFSERWNSFFAVTRFSEGDVYRFKIGPLFFKALVDRQSEHQRTLREQQARQQLAEWK